MAKVETIKREKEEMKNGMMVNRNMNGEDRANEKLEAGIMFRDLKNLRGDTLEEKLTNLGIEVPKTLTMNKAMELIKEKLGK